MNVRRVVLTAGAVFLSAALAVTFFVSESKPAFESSSDVYTWDCEYPEIKPEAITFTCADGGQYVDGISWSSWGKDGAQGTGEYHANTCDPNCAEGEFLSSEVEVTLSDLTEYKGLDYLRTLTMKTINGENLPESEQRTYEWDVMEFAEMMEE